MNKKLEEILNEVHELCGSRWRYCECLGNKEAALQKAFAAGQESINTNGGLSSCIGLEGHQVNREEEKQKGRQEVFDELDNTMQSIQHMRATKKRYAAIKEKFGVK